MHKPTVMNCFYTFFWQDDEEPGIIEQLKSQVCDNIVLYAQKYDEEFRKYVPQFLEAIWALLNGTNQQPKFDAVSIKFQPIY